jgi:hypothetical protein
VAAQGPVQFCASAALASHCASCECMELVRASYYGYYGTVCQRVGGDKICVQKTLERDARPRPARARC